MNIIPTRKYIRQLDVLLRGNKRYRLKVIKVMQLMDFNLTHPSLRLHKIVGNGEVYSVSVDMKIRILFAIDSNNIWLLEIGNHDEVY